MTELRGRTVLITGAARGIGQALASRFAREGSRVIVSDLPGQSVARTLDLIATLGGDAVALPMDVTDPTSVAAAAETLRARHGGLDVLVNNAGTVRGGPFLDVELADHLLTYRVNTFGPVIVTHALLGDLIARPSAHVVNIASAAGWIGLPWGSTYASSKWAVVGLGESLRLELAEQGHRHVGVTTVCPSYTRTGLFEGARPARTTRVLSHERLADRVVGAVLGDRPFVMTPWLVQLVPLLRGLLPTRAFDVLTRGFGATTSMRNWRGRASAPDRGEHERR
jgi:all-trans-retinol dehydrogenase (NAD+)